MARDLNDTLIFVKVVELGSFIAAARALRLPKTSISRKVQELETRLGAQLLHRTTRKLGLTEAGNLYYEHCQRIARDLDEAESAVTQLQSGPRGWLRLTAPYSIGTSWIAPLLGEFGTLHPDIRVEMQLNNDTVDLIQGEIDVALRVGSLPDSNLVARRLAVFHTRVYASPRYIERHGEPLQPEDLVHHRALFVRKQSSPRGNQHMWPLLANGRQQDYPVNPVVVANDPAPLTGALLCGEGLMLSADVLVKALAEQGLVRPVLAGWTGPDFELNAVFPRGHVVSPKVRAFVDFLVSRLRFDADYMSSLCKTSALCLEGATVRLLSQQAAATQPVRPLASPEAEAGAEAREPVAIPA